MERRLVSYWLAVVGVVVLSLSDVGPGAGTAFGYPNGPAEFCDRYPTSPLCAAAMPDCSLCHKSASGGSRNPYGDCLQKAGFLKDIDGSLAATEAKDCDGDGISSLDEIIAGTFPGDPASKPKTSTPGENPPPPELSCEEKNELSDWNVCGYDPLHVFRKVNLDFCRKPASMTEIESFRKLSAADQKEKLHDTLDSCLAGESWIGRDGAVWRVGYSVVNPLQTIKSGDNGGTIPLGDYDDDFALWMYYNTGGRDVRGILTAQHYVVRETNPTRYVEVEEAPLSPKASGIPQLVEMFMQSGSQQFVPKAKRAGLLTTNWSLVSRTMFTSTPRAAANAALRIFLGIDIAKGEGLADLYPKDSSFVLHDYDNKGILTKECSFCHQALDPVTYPFTEYNGLSFGLDSKVLVGLILNATFNGAQKACGKLDTSNVSLSLTGDLSQFDCYFSYVTPEKREEAINSPTFMLPSTYKAQRIDILAVQNAASEPNLAQTPTAGYLLGEPVADLVEWAEVAANSDAFAKQMALQYWMLLVGHAPTSTEKAEFDMLWKNLKQKHTYSVNAMMHDLIETEVYGAP